MKLNSPQLGFNNNVRHKGRVFHIQTEDSGIKHPHVITHLFADGGRILKSTKTSYAEFLEDEELPKKVRALMQEQHKAMFIALRAGKFDDKIGEGPAEGAQKPEPAAESAIRPPQPSLANAAEFVRDPAALADTMPTGGPVAQVAPTQPVAQAQPAASAPTAQAAAPAPAVQPPAPALPPPSQSSSLADRATESEPRPRAITAAAAPIALASSRDRLGHERDTEVDSTTPKARLTPPPARNSQPPPPPPSQSGQPSRPKTAPPPPPAFRNMMGRPSSPDILSRGIPPARPADVAAASARPRQAAAPPPSSSGRPPESRPAAPSRGPQNHRPPLPAGLDLDLQALELASEQSNAPVYQQVRDLPPPPAAVFKGSLPESTAYRVTVPPAKTPAATRKPVIEERKLTPGASRYAPSRPASIFGNAKPQEGSSIFGEDLISEKSLDEVILSYLAEDLEGGTPKK